MKVGYQLFAESLISHGQMKSKRQKLTYALNDVYAHINRRLSEKAIVLYAAAEARKP